MIPQGVHGNIEGLGRLRGESSSVMAVVLFLPGSLAVSSTESAARPSGPRANASIFRVDKGDAPLFCVFRRMKRSPVFQRSGGLGAP